MAIDMFVGPKIRWQNAGVVFRLIAAVLVLAMSALIVLQGMGATTVVKPVSASGVTPTSGFGFIYVLHPQSSFSRFLTQGDNNDDPSTSRLILRQDGVIFGTPHSRHDEIVSQGHGRYSHWSGNLYFSTPDNTDPRVNGHVYTIDLPYVVPPWLILSALALALGGIVSRGAGVPGWKADTLFLSILVLTAGTLAGLTIGSVDNPAIVASSDGGNIGGWIAGQMFPDRFASDFLVSDNRNTAFYVSLVLPLVKFLSVLTGDIGTAYLWIELPILLAQVTGFYFLGRKMVQSRLWAAVLALMTCAPVFIWGQNDLFGPYWLPLVRMTYDAALPWLMLAFWTYGRRASTLPWLFAAGGFCIYLHPVSAPAGVAGLSLASLTFLRRDEPFWRRIAFVGVGAVVFGLVAIPFAIPFFSSFSGGEAVAGAADPALYARAMEEFRRANGTVYYDALLAFRSFIVGTGKVGWPVWLIGIMGLAVVPVINSARRPLCLFLSLFLAGCLIASVGICALDQALAGMLHRTPFQLDLIRGLRLTIVPLLIGFVLSLAEMQRALDNNPRYPIAARALAGSALLIVAGWWTVHPNRISDAIGLASLTNGVRHQNLDETKMMSYLREKPVDGTILPIVPAILGLAVRYAALQPVAFIHNDVNALFYSGSAKRQLWAELDALRSSMQEEGPESLAAYAALSERSKTRYVLVADDAVPAGVLKEILKSGPEMARFGNLSLVDLGTKQ